MREDFLSFGRWEFAVLRGYARSIHPFVAQLMDTSILELSTMIGLFFFCVERPFYQVAFHFKPVGLDGLFQMSSCGL